MDFLLYRVFYHGEDRWGIGQRVLEKMVLTNWWSPLIFVNLVENVGVLATA